MYNPDETMLTLEAAQQFQARLAEVGSLKRLNKDQQRKLHDAHDIFFHLVRNLHEAWKEPDEPKSELQGWRRVALALRKVDPLWATRAVTMHSSVAVSAAIARLVDPQIPPIVDYGHQPTLRDLVLRYYGEDERFPTMTDAYFGALADRTASR